ncbi:MAG: thiamine-phosphate kinase [Alphaproteobacteria bacterium]|nr:thiamine-phosphate kinase [Alphaproteobacteria bacterium]
MACAPTPPTNAVPAPPALDEFQRIARFYAPLAAGAPGAAGLKDDAAVVTPTPGHEIVVTADALIEGVHFRSEDPPDLVARKMLRVNLSDLAAKGARPFGYLMTTALPVRCGDDWVERFAAGLARDQAEYGVSLLGGDSVATPGPIALSVTALGELPAGTAVRRGGARPGDAVLVTGTIGDGALGLLALGGALPALDAAACDRLADRYLLPQPRTRTGPALRGIARAMMDVSDGLVADLGHIAETSGVGAVIERDRVPLSPAARAAVVADPACWEAVLGGGDDYELLLTAAPDDPRLDAVRALGVPVTAIGRVVAGAGVAVLDAAGRPVPIARTGYRHL